MKSSVRFDSIGDATRDAGRRDYARAAGRLIALATLGFIVAIGQSGCAKKEETTSIETPQIEQTEAPAIVLETSPAPQASPPPLLGAEPTEPPVAAEEHPPVAAVIKPPAAGAEGAALEGDLGAVWDQLRQGTLVYAPQRKMKQGVATSITARVGLSSAGLERELPVEEQPGLIRQPIKVSSVMTAKLQYDDEVFRVVPASSETQPLVGDYIEWRWWITPLRSGRDYHIRVLVSARVRLPDGKETFKDLQTGDALITVDVNALYVTRKFIAKNWQWLIGGPVTLGVIGWLKTRISKRRRRRR